MDATGSRLVGRGRELARLEDALAAASAGGGRALLVAGEAGVGKTRLLEEAAARARARGMAVVLGRAVRGAGEVPFRPIAQALAGALRATPLSEDRLRPFLPALGRLLPGWFAAPAPAATPDLVYVAEGALRLLQELAGRRGALLVVEDLQWADPESLAVVAYLADAARSSPLTVAASLRDDEPASQELAGAARAFERVLLGRLADERDIGDLAAAWLDGAVPPAVTELLVAHADGLPLLVEELLAALVSSGRLRRDGEHWCAPERLELELPATVAGTVEERLRSLPDPARTVLAAAALFGRRFDATLLAGACGLGVDDASAAVRGGVELRLLAPAGGEADELVRFRHALTREAVLRLTPPPERRRLAARALATVDAVRPGLPGDWCLLAAELALHAGLRDRAVELLEVAGERARQAGAVGSAIAALERAMGLLDDGGPRTASVGARLLDAIVAGGQAERARALATRLLAGTDSADVHAAAARAALLALDTEAAREQLEAARRLRGGEDSVDLDLLGARVALAAYRFEEAEALARRAGAAAGLRAERAEALLLAGQSLAARDVDAAEEVLGEAVEAAESAHLTAVRALALHALGGIDVLRVGRGDRIAGAREAALEAGMVGVAAAATHDLAMWRLLRFELAEGRRWADETVAAGRRWRLGWVLGAGLTKQAFAAALEGRFDDVEPLLDEAESLAGGDARGLALMDGHVRAAVALGREDAADALACTERAVARWAEHRLEPRPYLGLWALLGAVVGRVDPGAAWGRLEEGGALWQPAVRGLALAARAIGAARSGRPAEADVLIGDAAEALAATPWLGAMARRHAAPELLTHGSDRAEALLREADAFFAEARLEAPAAACRAALRRAGRRVPRRGRGAATVPAALRARGVTSREMDVLLLVAKGLTNREVAERLFLSPRTVDTHVQHLLAKTGAANRTALAAATAQSP